MQTILVTNKGRRFNSVESVYEGEDIIPFDSRLNIERALCSCINSSIPDEEDDEIVKILHYEDKNEEKLIEEFDV